MEQVNQLKNDFIAAVTHDLRTPLMVIKGFGELLAEREDELLDDERRAVDAINLNAERLSELIEMLLQMSELDAGMVVLQRAPTDVPAVLRRVVDEIGYHAEQKGVNVNVLVRGGVPMLELDAARLEQVIANLLNNAIKFTPEGGDVKIAVEFRDEQMVLIVSDTGPGIPPDILPHIFDRFYRGHHVAGDRRQTGGLGLAIAKGIVELHGGTIGVESRLGDGTTFTVTLPRLVARDAGEEGQDADDRALAGMLRPSRPLPNAR
jgi:signal transduction histidine kinase